MRGGILTDSDPGAQWEQPAWPVEEQFTPVGMPPDDIAPSDDADPALQRDAFSSHEPPRLNAKSQRIVTAAVMGVLVLISLGLIAGVSTDAQSLVLSSFLVGFMWLFCFVYWLFWRRIPRKPADVHEIVGQALEARRRSRTRKLALALGGLVVVGIVMLAV